MLHISNDIIDFINNIFAGGIIPRGVTRHIGISSKITSFDWITLFYRQ